MSTRAGSDDRGVKTVRTLTISLLFAAVAISPAGAAKLARTDAKTAEKVAKVEEKAAKPEEKPASKVGEKPDDKAADAVDGHREEADGDVSSGEGGEQGGPQDAGGQAGEGDGDGDGDGAGPKGEGDAASGADGASVRLGPDAPPVPGRRVGADVAAGVIQVRLPGAREFTELRAAATMPLGTVIDARAGSVVLETALPGHKNDRATFGGGLFEVRQNLRDRITELRLRGGSYRRCNSHMLLGTRTAKRRPDVIRRLWGRDRGGRFRTHGHNSIATVRGTRWLTEERCDGTLTRVTEGAVEVRHRRTGKRVLLRAGDSYLARRLLR
jgi:hypothetical protein